MDAYTIGSIALFAAQTAASAECAVVGVFRGCFDNLEGGGLIQQSGTVAAEHHCFGIVPDSANADFQRFIAIFEILSNPCTRSVSCCYLI